MTVFHTYNPTLFNEIAAIPSVRATFGHHIAEADDIDFAILMNDPRYIFLTNGEDACAFYYQHSPIAFDGHSLAAPSCRGKRAIQVGKEMLEWLWINTSAEIVTGATPIELKAARMFNRWIGMTSLGQHPHYAALATYQAEHFFIKRPVEHPRRR
jgi:hypothetical protein